MQLGTHQATRQQWQNACGYLVLDGFTSLGGDHGPSDALFKAHYVIPFLGLDKTGAVDPEVQQCGNGGTGGGVGTDAGADAARDGGAGGSSGAGGAGGRGGTGGGGTGGAGGSAGTGGGGGSGGIAGTAATGGRGGAVDAGDGSGGGGAQGQEALRVLAALAWAATVAARAALPIAEALAAAAQAEPPSLGRVARPMAARLEARAAPILADAAVPSALPLRAGISRRRLSPGDALAAVLRPRRRRSGGKTRRRRASGYRR